MSTPAMNEVAGALQRTIDKRGAPVRFQVDQGRQVFRDPRIPVGIVTPTAVDAFTAYAAVTATVSQAALRNAAAARHDAHLAARSNLLGRPARAPSRDLSGGPGG